MNGGILAALQAAFTASLYFSTPANLGASINTPDDDGGPALSCDGMTLYFYSTRPGGFGGRDLYVAHRHRLDHH